MEISAEGNLENHRELQYQSELIRQMRQEKFDNLLWTPEEQIFRNRHKSKLLSDREVPFSSSALVKFRSSIFGPFLHELNRQQTQDKYFNKNKLDILKWDTKDLSPAAKIVFNGKNDLSDDFFGLLLKAVTETDCIDWDFLYQHLITLRINDYYITVVDKELSNFRNLQVLVLCGNWIEDFNGANLPERLKFLELFANEIADVTNLCLKAPESLLHLGLGRNKLTNDSNLDVLKKCGKFESLRTLDLSDNDIYCLVPVLKQLKGLEKLAGLNLEGNPCAVCVSYKDAVVSSFPQLLYLDNTEIFERDKHIRRKNLSEDAAFVFSCHRIMGLPPPPKEKGLIQTIHLEVSLPLLEEITLENPQEPVQDEDDHDDRKKKGKKGDKKAKDKKSKASKSKKGKKGKDKAPSPYEAEDEHETERKLRIKNTAFKTDRVPWAKIVQFPEQTLLVESPEKDLTRIRDTFRSTVNVKVVYLKIEPPQKPKKGGKGGGKKDKKGKGGKKGKKGEAEKPQKVEEPKEPQETILKKVTLANFHCDLRGVNWSDRTSDFYWAAHPKSNPIAIPVEGSLRAITYIEGKPKKEKPAKKGSEKGAEAEDVFKVPSKQFLPSIFTCQLGFGLRRSFNV